MAARCREFHPAGEWPAPRSPDHHSYWVDANAQRTLRGHRESEAARAVGDLRAKVDPLAGQRLCHDVDVHLVVRGCERPWGGDPGGHMTEWRRAEVGLSLGVSGASGSCVCVCV